MSKRAWITGAAVAGVVAVGVGAFLLTGSGEPAAAPGNLSPATTEITRADLVRSKTIDGRFDFAERRAVKSPVEGTVTKAAEPGKLVERGQVLYQRDARPVVLLYGLTPMFRDLKAGDLGPDVQQLKRNLRALGKGRNLNADNRYDEATKAAVQAWQRSLGLPEPTGELGWGDIVFQQKAVRVVEANARLADRIGGDKPVLTVAATTPVVRAELDRSDQGLGKAGTRVEIALPGGGSTGGQVAGTVQPETETGAPANTTQVEITLDEPARAEGQSGPVRVTFVQDSRKGVLTVPVEAVLALREGGYGLQLVEGNNSRTVTVHTGMTADGRIEVSGSGLAEGMKVGTARP